MSGGLWITLLLVSIIGRILVSSLRINRRGRKQWENKGIEADAVILKMEETGRYIKKMPQVRLQVQVTPDTGRNFVAETNEVSVNPELKEGSIVKVKYNPNNRRELMLIRDGGQEERVQQRFK